MKLKALFLALALFCGASLGGYWIGRTDQRVIDAEHAPAPFSVADATIEALSDWVGGDSRAALIDARRGLIEFLAGNSIFLLNADFTQEGDCRSTAIRSLYPNSYGGLVANDLFGCRNGTDFAFSRDFAKRLAVAKQAHPLSDREQHEMQQTCANYGIDGTMIDSTIEGHHYPWVECLSRE